MPRANPQTPLSLATRFPAIEQAKRLALAEGVPQARLRPSVLGPCLHRGLALLAAACREVTKAPSQAPRINPTTGSPSASMPTAL